MSGIIMDLTEKELETLELLKKLKLQKDVAKELGVTEPNVSQTMNRIKTKIKKSKKIMKIADEKGYLGMLGID